MRGTCIYNNNSTGVELHHFVDVSDVGYGVVSYARYIDIVGSANSSLLMSRARVNPVKKITVPRLELTASTVAVRLDNMIQEHFGNYFVRTYFWTDSMSVLRYIWNESSRFPTFVSNRLAVIKEATVKSQWKYVPSAQNPADDVSRGMSAKNLLNSTRWLNGPEFLHYPESQWPEISIDMTISDDMEVCPRSCSNAVVADVPVITKLMEYFSDWYKLVKSVAWLLVFKSYIQSCANKPIVSDDLPKGVLTPTLMDKAELAI